MHIFHNIIEQRMPDGDGILIPERYWQALLKRILEFQIKIFYFRRIIDNPKFFNFTVGVKRIPQSNAILKNRAGSCLGLPLDGVGNEPEQYNDERKNIISGPDTIKCHQCANTCRRKIPLRRPLMEGDIPKTPLRQCATVNVRFFGLCISHRIVVIREPAARHVVGTFPRAADPT